MLDPQWEPKTQVLSRQFGEAQYFASMRVSSAYAWAQLRNGEVICLFDSGDGKEPRREGFERELESVVRLRFVDGRPPDSKGANEAAHGQTPFPDEEDVLRVASIWSIDPMKLNEYPEADASGLIGRYQLQPAP